MEQEFEIRVCTSGSSGVAFYIPSAIVKQMKLKNEINTKITAVLDDDNDMVIYTSEITSTEKSEEDDTDE